MIESAFANRSQGGNDPGRFPAWLDDGLIVQPALSQARPESPNVFGCLFIDHLPALRRREETKPADALVHQLRVPTARR